MTVDFNSLLVSYIKGDTPPEIINDWLLEHGDQRKIAGTTKGCTAERLVNAAWVAPQIVRIAFISSLLVAVASLGFESVAESSPPLMFIHFS